ncbi:prepilin peptidase [Lacisediminihabitans changchengi]|uniref:Prepilin peptidase n=1 Tax=Lacisediminihabitans changchengi TaxID=2787634 RepID=A0A934SN26_9MICO|nr:A24 family peptidase [Lacisediminihabitans changchengi]MBK4348416.1 prepilin peptidase [Lacisediminihabitans changchengi]
MIAVIVIAGALGLLIGSFLNVVIYRVPAGKSIVSPPSACPNCGSRIAGYDNVPVLSWLVLRGKCRSCATPISARYPIIELVTGIAFAGVAALLGAPLAALSNGAEATSALLVLVAFLYFAAISIALAMIDIDTHRLPNAIVLPSYLVGIVLLSAAAIISSDYAPLIRAAIGMAILFVAYFAMAFVYPAGMGLGDVKLAGVIGLYLGWTGWGAFAVGAFAAFILAGLFAIVLIVARRANRKSGIPFGPWMLIGAWFGVALGSSVFDGYLRLFGLAAA